MSNKGLFLKRKNLVFYWTSAVLLVVLVLYPLFGGIMMSIVLPKTGGEDALPWLDRENLPAIRAVQVVGQVLVLCLPVLFLAGLQTGVKRPFSRENLAFLGFGRKVSGRGVLLAVAGVLLLQPFIYVVIESIGYLLPYLGKFGESLLENQAQLEQFLMFLAEADSVNEFVAVAVVVAVVPALCEEMFFRGYIQKNYMDSLSPAGGIVLTGFVFGLFHLSPANLIPLTFMGWYLGYVYYKTQNLLVPVVVHFGNNFLSLAVLQVQRIHPDVSGNRMVTGEMIGWAIFVLAVSLLLFVFVMRRFNSLFSLKSC